MRAMVDDLIELAVDVGSELLEAAIGLGLDRRKKKQEKADVPEKEPWEREDKKLPWEK